MHSRQCKSVIPGNITYVNTETRVKREIIYSTKLLLPLDPANDFVYHCNTVPVTTV